ncbi:MAG TPA: redoxin domain-containing protein [Thermoanaerobaculia bacterium]|nr:redoxin domain-containing protein [Thermoanaerobaculia bacterium]
MTRREFARGAGFLALVFVAAFGGVWAGMQLRQSRAPSPPQVDTDLVPGAALPAGTVLDTSGQSHDLAQLAGGGGVVMFLSIDCGACGMTLEHWRPEIEGGALAGVPIIGISADRPERFAEFPAKGATFPVYRDENRDYARDHGVSAVPFVVVVGPGGEIREQWIGHREDVDFERIRELATG